MQSYIFFRNQTTIPRNFTVATAENILPQIARISQKDLLWKRLPQIARIFTNSAWCVGAPTESTDLTEPLA